MGRKASLDAVTETFLPLPRIDVRFSFPALCRSPCLAISRSCLRQTSAYLFSLFSLSQFPFNLGNSRVIYPAM
jgi:hypothetical protein